MSPAVAPVIFAAGGLLWRPRSDRRRAEDENEGRGAHRPPRSADEPDRRLALIHRPRHGDWTLPKGKLEPGERWERAALREVAEETGFRAELIGFAGMLHYEVAGAPKIVLFWNMRAVGRGRFRPTDEVDALAWLTPAEALATLDHEIERSLLRRQRAAHLL